MVRLEENYAASWAVYHKAANWLKYVNRDLHFVPYELRPQVLIRQAMSNTRNPQAFREFPRQFADMPYTSQPLVLQEGNKVCALSQCPKGLKYQRFPIVWNFF